MSWFIENKLREIVDKNVTTSDWEGDEIDKAGIIESIETFYQNLMEGLITFTFQDYTLTKNGYEQKETGIIDSKKEIVERFFNSLD